MTFNRRNIIFWRNRGYLRWDCPYLKKKGPLDGNVIIFRYQKSTLQCPRKSVSRRVWTLLISIWEKCRSGKASKRCRESRTGEQDLELVDFRRAAVARGSTLPLSAPGCTGRGYFPGKWDFDEKSRWSDNRASGSVTRCPEWRALFLGIPQMPARARKNSRRGGEREGGGSEWRPVAREKTRGLRGEFPRRLGGHEVRAEPPAPPPL